MKTKHLTLLSNVRRRLRDAPCFLGDCLFSHSNARVIYTAFEMWLFLIEDVMTAQGITETRRSNIMELILDWLDYTNVRDVLDLLDTISEEILKACSYSDFKRRVEQAMYQIDIRPIFKVLNRSLTEFFREKGDKSGPLAQILKVSRFLKKLELQDVNLEVQAMKDYVETETDLCAMSDYDGETINCLADIVYKWFSRFHITELLPRHGTGSVFEGGLTTAEKFAAIRVDESIKLVLSSPCRTERWENYFPSIPPDGLVRCSRITFVPKTRTKLRTISMEPTGLQYLQQGVMHALYSYIEKHPYLGVRLDLHDQSRNQYMALEGSSIGSYATLDLSKASDYVTIRLVRGVFRRVPGLLKWLIATRSNRTLLPDGSELPLQKFAPMGSAVCFPIESIIFGAICEYASQKVRWTDNRHIGDWSVYGDDIVINYRVTNKVIEILTSLGFKLNTEKSYTTGLFRESCGGEYYNGEVVTPLSPRLNAEKIGTSPSSLAFWCSFANQCDKHRLPALRAYCVSIALAFRNKYKVYFTSNRDHAPYIYSSQPTNHLVKPRWNADYCRYEGRFLSVKTCQRDLSCDDDDDLRYHIVLVDMKRSPTIFDQGDAGSANELRGCVEKFCSTALPIENRYRYYDYH